MKLNNEPQDIFLEVHSDLQMTEDMIDQFKENEIRVPDVIFAMYNVDTETLEKLHIMGVKQVYHSLTPAEIIASQRAMLYNLLDELQNDIDHGIESLEYDIHNRVSEISDKLYNTINLFDPVEYKKYSHDEFA